MNIIIVLALIVVLVIAIPLFLGVTSNAKIIFWLTLLFIFLPIGYINRYFVSSPLLKWIPFGVVFLCFIAIVLRQMFSGKMLIPGKLVPFFLSIFFISVISLLFNHISAEPALFSGLGLFAYFFLATVFNYKKYTLTTYRFLKILVVFGSINIGVSFFQRLFLVTLMHKSSDMVAGLFSTDGQFTIYQLFCLIIVLVYTFFDKRMFQQISNLKLAVLLMISLAISGNVAFVFFLPLAFFAIFLFVEKKKFFRKFRALFGIFVFIIGVVILFSLLYSTENQNKNKVQDDDLFTLLSDPEFIKQNLFGSDYTRNTIYDKNGGLRRGASILFTYNLVSGSFGNLILGRGPGSTSETTLPGAEGSLDKRFKGLNLTRTSYSFIIAELGFSGILIAVLFLSVLFFWKSKADESNAESVIRKSLVVVLIIYFGYENVFNDIEMALVFTALTLK